MTAFHIFTMTTPYGRVTYAHQALERLSDGADGFITDATLDAEDGTEVRALSLAEVTQYIRLWGPAKVVWPS